MASLSMKNSLFIIAFSFLLLCCKSKTTKDQMPELDGSTMINTAEPQLFVLNKAIEEEPENPTYYYKRAKIYYNDRAFDIAIKDITEALRLDSSYGDFYFLLGKVYHAQQKDYAAFKALKKAEELDVNEPELYTLLASTYLNRGEVGDARNYLEKAASVIPYNTEVYLLKGRLSLYSKDTVGALNNLYSSLKADSANAGALKELVGIYEGKRKYDTAMAFVLTGRTVAPKDPFFVYYEGKVMQDINYTVAAKRAFETALQLEPSFYQASYSLGIMDMRKDNLRGALYYFNNVLHYHSGDKKANFYIGEIYEKTGRAYEAISYYEKADTANGEVKVRLAALYKIYPKKIEIKTVTADTTAKNIVKSELPKAIKTDTLKKLIRRKVIKKDTLTNVPSTEPKLVVPDNNSNKDSI